MHFVKHILSQGGGTPGMDRETLDTVLDVVDVHELTEPIDRML